MATVITEAFDDAVPVKPGAAVMPIRRRRWAWLFLAPVLVVLALPTVLSLSPFRGRILQMATGQIDGTVACESLSLGWFSSQSVGNLSIVGRDGKALLAGATIEVPKSLLSLARSPGELGTVKITGPQLSLHVRADGSNLEDVLAKLLEPAEEKSEGTVRGTIDVSGATATIVDEVRQREWKITSFDANVELSPDAATSLKGKIAAQFAADPDTPRVTCEFVLPNTDAADASTASGELSLKTERLPLDLCEAFARRWDANLRLSGRMTTDLAAQWPVGDAGGVYAIRGTQTIEALRYRATSLGSDELRLVKAEGPFDLRWDGKQLDVKPTSLDCDVGRIALQGTAAVEHFAMTSLVAALATASIESSADVDLARVAAMLPETLRVRPGTRIVGGKLEARLGRRVDASGQTSIGNIGITNLAAEENGQMLRWDGPLHLSFDVNESPRGVVVNRLACESDFLTFNGRGTLADFAGDMQFDLDRLMSNLGRFIDVGNAQLAGTGKGRLQLRRGDDGVFGANGTFDVNNFRFAMPGDRVWEEHLVRLKLDANGLIEDGPSGRRLAELHAATASVESSGEQLVVQLAKPVFKINNASPWPLNVRVTNGNLTNWTLRLRPWIQGGDWQAAGICNATAAVTLSIGAIDLTKFNAAIDEFIVSVGGRERYLDPNVALAASGRYDFEPARLAIYDASFRGTGAGIDAKECRIALDGAQSTGDASFELDLERASPWLSQLLAGAGGGDLSGQIVGSMRLENQGGTTRLVASVAGDNLGVISRAAARTPGSMALVDRKLRVAIDATYDRTAGALRLANGQIEGEAIQLAAQGSVTGLNATTEVDITGKLDYDLARLTPILRWYLGNDIRLSGKGPQTFAIRGPLDGTLITAAPIAEGARPATVPRWREAMMVDAGIGWQEIQWYDFRVGPGQLRGRLANGRLVVDPIQVALQEGQLTLAPQLYLTADPILMALPKGPVLKQVRLTPDLCAAGLKFVHPFLAGTTNVDGHVSLDLDGAWIPLSNMRGSQAAGKMHIHQVEVSGGPLLGDVLPAVLMIQPQKVPLLPEVEFWVQDGRVHHRGVGVQFRETVVSTQGSVGFDETLDIVAEMNVPEKWLGQNVLGTALKNQKIKVPIKGTLSRPQIDAQELAKLRAEFVGEAAGNILRDELFDRLLRPREPSANQPR
jgi:translocation and assembly module TamB